jgi:hypothetical protein
MRQEAVSIVHGIMQHKYMNASGMKDLVIIYAMPMVLIVLVALHVMYIRKDNITLYQLVTPPLQNAGGNFHFLRSSCV